MAWRLITVALVSAPLSIGMGHVIAAMFPHLAANTAGLIGGALTCPTILIAIAAGQRW